jgi:hypothetical protein
MRAEKRRKEWGLSGAQTLTLAADYEEQQRENVEDLVKLLREIIAAPMSPEQLEYSKQRARALLR